MPTKSSVVLTPVAVTCGKTGTYSIAFSIKGSNVVVANNIEVAEENVECAIASSRSFECPAEQIDQSVIVFLLNSEGESLTAGTIPVFSEFAVLEPSNDSRKIFEPQQLK